MVVSERIHGLTSYYQEYNTHIFSLTVCFYILFTVFAKPMFYWVLFILLWVSPLATTCPVNVRFWNMGDFTYSKCYDIYHPHRLFNHKCTVITSWKSWICNLGNFNILPLNFLHYVKHVKCIWQFKWTFLKKIIIDQLLFILQPPPIINVLQFAAAIFFIRIWHWNTMMEIGQ